MRPQPGRSALVAQIAGNVAAGLVERCAISPYAFNAEERDRARERIAEASVAIAHRILAHVEAPVSAREHHTALDPSYVDNGEES